MSGVYIKSMEMPKSCYNCAMVCDDGDYPMCRITGEQRGYTFNIRERRMDNCPIVPVPDHGDLIDRDALLDAWDEKHTIPSAAAKVMEKTIIPTDKEDGNAKNR